MRADPYRLRELLGPSIAGLGCELVGIEYHPNSANALLRIYIDRTEGVTVDDCERVSRQVSALLDVADPVPGHYTLEVSSPGLDRPLFEPSHFERYAGRQAKVQLGMALDGRRRYTGEIVGLRGTDLVLQCEGLEVVIPLDRIEKARLVPEF